MADETLAVARPRWLGVARVAWVVVAAAELVVFVASAVAYWPQLNTVCNDPSPRACNFTQLTPAVHETLGRLGIPLATYAGYTLVIHLAASLALLTVGMLVFWRKSDGWYGLFVSLLLVTLGAIGPSAVLFDAFEWAYADLAAAVAVWDFLALLVFPALGLFLVTFPDGRFVPRWSFVIVVLWVLQAVFFETIDRLPAPLFATELLMVWGSTLAVQVYRYRRVSNATQRQQTKWVLFGFALGASTIIVALVLSLAFPGFGERGSAFRLLEGTWVALLFTPIPLCIGIAVLKYRLWDIDPIINRTLVYGALTACVVGVYVLVVGYLGSVFRTGGNLAVSLVATGIVAVMFAPLRERLQRGVNRLMYGERDDPYRVISYLGERLEGTLAPETVLPTIVQTVREALKLPYAAIVLGEGRTTVAATEHEPPASGLLRLPLGYGGESVGELLLAPRSPEEGFSAADRRLLHDLARQAGIAVHAVRLTDDLQRSRERLVTTREEERRRLRRDLHDGLGPTLGGLPLKLDVAGDLMERDPAAARDLLRNLKAQARDAVTDVRRLVHELRPPALDDLGLVGAVREVAAQHSVGGLRVSFEAPKTLPPLTAAAEVAAYRIAQEALTNVARHAGAKECSVRLSLGAEPPTLRLEVRDDGRGLEGGGKRGVGLHSMRERAEELGGSCAVESPPEGGTRVRASLPVPKAPSADPNADA